MKKSLCILVFLTLFGVFGFAESTASHGVTMTVPQLALIGLNDSTSIALTVELGGAGDQPIGVADSSKYLRYTSVTSGTTSRTVTVHWDSTDSSPAGTELHVAVSTPSGTGVVGTAASGDVKIGTAEQTIITGVKSGYTGSDPTSGAKLTYSLVVTSAENLVAGDNQAATVTFTLTDAS